MIIIADMLRTTRAVSSQLRDNCPLHHMYSTASIPHQPSHQQDHSYRCQQDHIKSPSSRLSPRIHLSRPTPQSHHQLILNAPGEKIPYPPFPSLRSTFSLCAIFFFRWTSKASTPIPGPALYSFPGQSRHLILGKYLKRTVLPVKSVNAG